jgi:hypothetical protein
VIVGHRQCLQTKPPAAILGLGILRTLHADKEAFRLSQMYT